MINEDFTEVLHRMMHAWSWPEWQIQEWLPRMLRVLEGVGILMRYDDTYAFTELVEDNATWDRVWQLLEKEGMAGPTGPAY